MLFEFNTIDIPEEISLLPSYPNPFNPSTHVQFTIPSDMNVALKVYDINGRLIDEIVNSNLTRGYYNFEWDANKFSSGVYFIQLRTGEKQEMQNDQLNIFLYNWWRSIDRNIFITTIILIVIGCLISFVATPSIAIKYNLEPYYFVKKHLIII